MQYSKSLLALFSSIALASAAQAPICEDTIDSQPPFNNNNIPCLLNCNTPISQATGGLLPGSINATNVPYCRLNCVRGGDVTPAQSAAAPACNERCEKINSATPDQLGWCIYWCVEGGEFEELVVSTTCVPSIQYTPVSTFTAEQGHLTYTVQGVTMPTQWASWYETQTVIPRTSPSAFAPNSTASSTSTTDDGYYDSDGRYHVSSETSVLSSSTAVSMAPSAETTSRASLTSSTTTPATIGEGEAKSAEEQTASTTATKSGSSGAYQTHWLLQAALAWLVILV